MLSANVFAIEHLNGAHSGSLLARRAVVADTDGPFLQKRNNGKEQEEQEEQAKPKVSVLILTLAKSHDKGKGARKKAYTGLGSGRGRLSFVDAPRDFSSQVLGYTRKGLSPVKLGLEWVVNESRLLVASERVSDRLVGKKGNKIGDEVDVMLEYALKISKICKKLYKDPVESPFSLYLSSAISYESKEEYKGLRNDVMDSIKLYISVINTAIKSTINDPKNVVFELKKL
ncbi:hypothetical protein BASA60_008901 [Batrachochytrium salamandrivorans]|nr:hypothetical protein BASA60_008901 [Batrachochytrium salamandrivorans]